MDGAWITAMLLADRCGHADDLPHRTRCLHDAHRTKRLVCRADVSASHEEIVYVAAVQAPIRDPVWPVVGVALAEGCRGDELIPLMPLAVTRVGMVGVDAPGAGNASILVSNTIPQVRTRQDEIAHETT